MVDDKVNHDENLFSHSGTFRTMRTHISKSHMKNMTP